MMFPVTNKLEILQLSGYTTFFFWFLPYQINKFFLSFYFLSQLDLIYEQIL